MPSTPNPPRRQLHPWIASTIVMIFGVGLLAVLVQQGYVDLTDEPIEVTVLMPETVPYGDGTGTLTITAEIELKNNTDEIVNLQASDPCRVVRWFVMGGGDAFIQSKYNEEACEALPMSSFVGPGEVLRQTVELPLEMERYVADTDYRLMVRYWGHDGFTDFTVE